MDYKKKYEDALERAKNLKDNPFTGYNGTDLISAIFPELAESEDEKIRKHIIEILNRLAPCHFDGNERSKCISWLEKQGKQKPTERSEEDEKAIDLACSILYSNFNENENFDKNQMCIGEIIDKLKSLRPQKQQEWSKEDIDMIDWLIRCCEKEHEELCNDRYGHQDIVSDLKRDCRKKLDWLESLKDKVVPQKHWKPSENELKILRLVAEKDGACLMGLYEKLKAL